MTTQAPLRIALVAPFGLRPKGTTIARILPIAKVLAAQGATVRVIVPPWDDPTRAKQTWHEDGVQIIHTSLGPPLIKPAAIYSNLVRRISAFRPHVVHAFKPIGYSGALAWGLAAWGLGVRGWGFGASTSNPQTLTPNPQYPLIVVDADDLEGPRGWAGRRRLGLDGQIRGLQERAVLRRAPRVTVASRWLERFVGQLGVAPDRILYLPNGVPSSEFGVPRRSPSSELGTQNSQLVWYTRFTEASPQRAASLLAPLLRSRPKLRLTVIGDEVDPGNRHQLEQALENAEVHRQVDWLAYNPSVLSPDAVAIYPMDDEPLNWARCPTKVPDLMALGIAIVAEAVGEISTYLAGFEHECLVPPGDGEALRQRAAALLDDSAARAELGTRLQSASERWRWDKLAGGLLSWYQSC